MINKLDDELKNGVEKIINSHKESFFYSKKTIDTLKGSSKYFLSFINSVISIIAIVLLSSIFLFVSLLIIFNSGFPVFFKQKRIGKRGRIFKVYKFRTMKKNAEKILKSDAKLYKKYVDNDYKLHPKDDPRILKFGNFLRNSSIDEIPQFINVIKGDMSIVGPRPIVPEEIERYGEHSQEFLSVKPGITGLWQVCGRSNISYPDRKYLDLIYIQKKNFFLDLKIIFRTIIVVIKKVGAH